MTLFVFLIIYCPANFLPIAILQCALPTLLLLIDCDVIGYCRCVLNTRYKGYDAGNKYMLLGSILHEIFQKALTSRIQTESEMREMAQSVAHSSSYAHDM